MKELYNQTKQVEAMKILLEHYSSRDIHKPLRQPCPLCMALLLQPCDKCVWTVETGLTCKSYNNEKSKFTAGLTILSLRDNKQNVFNNGVLRDDHVRYWRKLRRQQLKRWIKKYNKP